LKFLIFILPCNILVLTYYFLCYYFILIFEEKIGILFKEDIIKESSESLSNYFYIKKNYEFYLYEIELLIPKHVIVFE
jgi:ABC-type multidrug transport system permease subunit